MQATLPPHQQAQAQAHFLALNTLFASRRLEFANYSDTEDCDNNLPKDPRKWSREHVEQWLQEMAKTHNLPDIQHSRFLMNGKALCLMSQSMFIHRVPLGGKLLYKDFQLRLCSAMHSII